MYRWILKILLIVGQTQSFLKTPNIFNVYDNPSNGTSYAIKSFSTPSVIGCVTACYLNTLCNGVSIEENYPVRNGENVSCIFMSNYDQTSAASQQTTATVNPPQITSKTYFSNDCSNLFDPCGSSKCENSGKCVRSTGFGCWNQPYTCNSADSCSGNGTCLICEVDTSDLILIDGIYFYVHGTVHNGTDLDPGLRPSCTESRARCQAKNMTLLTIKDAAKNATVAKLNLHKHECHSCFYQIGVHLLPANNTWAWDDDNMALADFRQWYPGQPDKIPGSTRAVFMPVNSYAWSDVSCDFPAYYICEYVVPV